MTMRENSPTLVERVFRDGSLINLYCSYWKGQFKLNPIELGLEAQNIPDFFSLGRKRLYQKSEYDRFNRVENEVRSNIYNNSLVFPISGLYFIPITLVPSVAEFIDGKIAEFNYLRDDFLRRYDTIREGMLIDYARAAEKAHENIINNGNNVGDLESFRETLLNHVRSLYPPRPELEAKFILSYQLFTISAPNIALSETNVEQVVDTIAERRRLTEQYQRQMDEQVQEFVSDAVAQLRRRIVEALVSLRKSFKSSKCVTEKTMNRVRRTIGQFKALNFMGDERINEMLEQFEEAYMTRDAKDYRDNVALLDQFRDATDEALESAQDASDVSAVTGRYVRRLNI